MSWGRSCPDPHFCALRQQHQHSPCHVLLPPQLGFFPWCNTIPGPGPSLSPLAAPHPPPSGCAIALGAPRWGPGLLGRGFLFFWGELNVQQLLWQKDQRHRSVARTNYSNEFPPVNEPRAAKGAQGKEKKPNKTPRGKNPQGEKTHKGEKYPQRKKKNPQWHHRVSNIPKTCVSPN